MFIKMCFERLGNIGLEKFLGFTLEGWYGVAEKLCLRGSYYGFVLWSGGR